MSALFRSARTTDLDRLYRRHAASVYRYAHAVLGSSVDAEDVTQQTFLNAYRALQRGTRPRTAENWLLTIAHNEVRRHFRNTQARPLEVELDAEISKPAPERSDPSVADIVRALQQLPPAQRSALVMREFEGRSYAEVAEIMDVSQSALEALLFRARRSLAEKLEEALTCAEAERALSLRLDGRLKRRERRRLKAHLRECPPCARFERVQRRQRSQLAGLSVMPIPASLVLVRGESAAAAIGLGATGGSTAAGAGGAGAAAIVSGVVTKAAAVTAAAATVAAGVGYGVAAGPTEPLPKAERTATPAVARSRPHASARPSKVGISLNPSDRSTKVRIKRLQSPHTTAQRKASRAQPARGARKTRPVRAGKAAPVLPRDPRGSAPTVKRRPMTAKHAATNARGWREMGPPVRRARLKLSRPVAATAKPKRGKDSTPAADAPRRGTNTTAPGR
jgi:RNA polymerase sigma-70 factor, ECF subfamily